MVAVFFSDDGATSRPTALQRSQAWSLKARAMPTANCHRNPSLQRLQEMVKTKTSKRKTWAPIMHPGSFTQVTCVATIERESMARLRRRVATSRRATQSATRPRSQHKTFLNEKIPPAYHKRGNKGCMWGLRPMGAHRQRVPRLRGPLCLDGRLLKTLAHVRIQANYSTLWKERWGPSAQKQHRYSIAHGAFACIGCVVLPRRLCKNALGHAPRAATEQDDTTVER